MKSDDPFKSIEPSWCPGCGDFGILNAVKKALTGLDLKPHQVLLCSGIGQAAKLPHYLRCNVFNGLHGRAIPAATGAKIANHELKVLAVGGDGDMYGEGGNHLIHAMRRNVDMTVLVHDNKIYGLTKGQASPTSDRGLRTKIQPHGVVNQPLNPLALAISQKCSFVARGFSGKVDHLAALIQEGISHRGFALIDILQPCVSFNKINTNRWYQARVYDINENGTYDPTDLCTALEKAYEWGDRIPMGVLFRRSPVCYEDNLPVLKKNPLVDQPVDPAIIQEIIDSFS